MDPKTRSEVIATLKKMKRDDLVPHLQKKPTTAASNMEVNEAINEVESSSYQTVLGTSRLINMLRETVEGASIPREESKAILKSANDLERMVTELLAWKKKFLSTAARARDLI